MSSRRGHRNILFVGRYSPKATGVDVKEEAPGAAAFVSFLVLKSTLVNRMGFS